MRRILAGLTLAAATLTATGPVNADTAITMQHCRSDDGQPFPCVWDARHMGNGLGQSFRTTRDGRTVYLTHARAHQLAYGN